VRSDERDHVCFERVGPQSAGHSALMRRLDDRPPPLDLGLVVGSQRLQSWLLAWWNLLAEISKAPAHRGSRQGIHGRGIELADDVLRRSLGYPKPVPDRDVESR
jgi:hypothetical protein